MKRRSRLLGLLAAAVMATVAALVPAGAAHADYFVNYRQVVNTGSFKCLEALGVDRNSPVGQRSCTGYSVQTSIRRLRQRGAFLRCRPACANH